MSFSVTKDITATARPPCHPLIFIDDQYTINEPRTVAMSCHTCIPHSLSAMSLRQSLNATTDSLLVSFLVLYLLPLASVCKLGRVA